MTTSLQLNRISSGYYTATHDGMTITVSNPEKAMKGAGGDDAWQLVIEIDGEITVDEWLTTKSEAYAVAVERLTA